MVAIADDCQTYVPITLYDLTLLVLGLVLGLLYIVTARTQSEAQAQQPSPSTHPASDVAQINIQVTLAFLLGLVFLLVIKRSGYSSASTSLEGWTRFINFWDLLIPVLGMGAFGVALYFYRTLEASLQYKVALGMLLGTSVLFIGVLRLRQSEGMFGTLGTFLYWLSFVVLLVASSLLLDLRNQVTPHTDDQVTEAMNKDLQAVFTTVNAALIGLMGIILVIGLGHWVFKPNVQ